MKPADSPLRDELLHGLVQFMSCRREWYGTLKELRAALRQELGMKLNQRCMPWLLRFELSVVSPQLLLRCITVKERFASGGRARFLLRRFDTPDEAMLDTSLPIIFMTDQEAA